MAADVGTPNARSRSSTVTKPILFVVLALAYSAIGMAAVRLCLSRSSFPRNILRWLFVSLCVALFSPVIVLTPSIGELVVPVAVAWFSKFWWHPLNFVTPAIYAIACFFVANRWYTSSLQGSSRLAWSNSTILKWYLISIVCLPLAAGLSLFVPPLGYLVSGFWMIFANLSGAQSFAGAAASAIAATAILSLPIAAVGAVLTSKGRDA